MRRQVPQRIPEEEKQQARRSCEKNLPVRDALGAHAARTPAAQSQKSRSEEFGQIQVSEKPRRTLDVPQQTVQYAERAAVHIEPSVAEPIEVEQQEQNAYAPHELHDFFQSSQVIFLLHDIRFLQRRYLRFRAARVYVRSGHIQAGCFAKFILYGV